MQQARCCAANAYDATSALHILFGSASRSQSLRPLTTVYRRDPSQTPRGRRSYATDTNDARHKVPGAPATGGATEIGGHARKMAFYEQLMSSESVTEQDALLSSKSQEKGQNREDEQIRQSSWERRLLGNKDCAWKTRMTVLAQYMRENRTLVAQGEQGYENGPERLESLDYKGITVSPEKSTVAKPMVRIPWVPSSKKRKDMSSATLVEMSSAALVLEHEITAFAKHMLPTKSETSVREKVLKQTRNIIYSSFGSLQPWQGYMIYRFGSMSTGLVMPYSDIDIGVYGSENPRHDLKGQMERLYETLKRGKDYICVVHRPPPNAIITAQHNASGIDVQIIAKGAPQYQDITVSKYLKQIPHLHDLYAVVRTAFGVRGFVDPFAGGISAYGTFMMLAAALTHRGTPETIHDSPATQLLHFLSFWADFDTTKYGITLGDNKKGKTRVADLFPKTTPTSDEERRSKIQFARDSGDAYLAGQYRIGTLRPRQPYLLCMQDPANPINDLGGNCHAFKHIQQTIRTLHRDLVRAMAEYDQAVPKGEVAAADFSLLMPLVGRSHELYAERRQRMRSFASRSEASPIPDKFGLPPNPNNNNNKFSKVPYLTKTLLSSRPPI